MDYDNYEVIDLSAHGLYRGLLVANHSRHDVRAAPKLFDPTSTRDWAPSDRITNSVYAVLEVERFQRMVDLVKATRHTKESVRCALRRLVADGRAEVRHGDQPNVFRQTRLEWRRTR